MTRDRSFLILMANDIYLCTFPAGGGKSTQIKASEARKNRKYVITKMTRDKSFLILMANDIYLCTFPAGGGKNTQIKASEARKNRKYVIAKRPATDHS